MKHEKPADAEPPGMALFSLIYKLILTEQPNRLYGLYAEIPEMTDSRAGSGRNVRGSRFIW